MENYKDKKFRNYFSYNKMTTSYFVTVGRYHEIQLFILYKRIKKFNEKLAKEYFHILFNKYHLIILFKRIM